MKNRLLLSIFAILFFFFVGHAQSEKSVDVLRSFVSNVKSIPSLEIKFKVSASDGKLKNSEYMGTVQAQRNSYRLMNPLLEIFCDGKTRWVLNVEKRELVIADNNPSNFDLIENPLGFFTNIEGAYSYEENAVSITVGRKSLWSIKLMPKKKRLPYKCIVLNIEKGSFKPVSVKYFAKDGSVYVTDILEFSPKEAWPNENFIFPDNNQKGLEIVDLRK